MVALVCPLLSLPGLFRSVPAHAANQITTIEIRGAQSVARETILSHMDLHEGGLYDAASADTAILRLYATGMFSDVRITQQGGRVVVSVVESPVIASIAFEGNSNVEKARLEPIVTLKPKSRYSVARAKLEAVKLRDYYRSLGRTATTVEPRATPQADGQVALVFAIREGDVTRIDSISFLGNRAFSTLELKNVVTTSESGWFDILKTAAFYDAERLKLDRDLLQRHYLKHGYPDARVTKADARKNDAGTGYAVTFEIEEGARYLMQPGKIESRLAKVDPSRLEPARQIRDGGVYSEEAIEKSVESMTLALSAQGHVFARVKPVPVRDDASKTMRIGFLVEEAPAQYAERIEITGNVKTRDYVIRRELRISEGDPVNALLLERARARVQALGFFKKVALKRGKGSAPEKLVVTVAVEEDDSRNIGFGVGYSSTEGIVGDLNLGEKNLFGTGQKLNLKLAGSLTRFQAEVGFTEPRFLGTNVAAGFDIFYKDIDYTQYASYKAQSIGFKLRAAYPVDDNWTVGANYSFANNRLYSVGDTASPAIKQAIPGYPDATSTTYNTSSIGYNVIYDTRDNKKRPTSGMVYTLSQDLAGVGGDVRYIRSVGEVKGYYPVTDSITGQVRAGGGTIMGWGGQDVRLLDLFYKGNDIVRGFAPAGIGPRDVTSANADALGGRTYFSTSAELLFAIPGVPQEMGLRGAVFADAGSLWNANKTAAANAGTAGNGFTPRASVGVGLGWDSPIGTLRVDYAIPIAKQPFDKTQALSFGLSPF